MSPLSSANGPETVVAVYVSRDAAANLNVGLREGVWGWKREQKELAGLRGGEWLVFGFGFTGRSPRTQPENWRQNRLERVIVAQVAGPVYVDDTKVWPDEGPELSYRNRVRIGVKAELRDVRLDGSALPIQVSDALKRSVNGGTGRLATVDSVTWQTFISSDDEANEGRLRDVPNPVEQFVAEVQASGMGSHPDVDERHRAFIASTLAKPLVILAGLSGSGKTQLALRLGEWFGADADGPRMLVVPVRPDWTGPEPLLGYEDALREPRDGRAAWVVPDPLRFLLRAAADPANPYLLLLDEMNLAHVERYFADLLSGMESGQPVLPDLHRGDDGEWRQRAASRLPLPRNVLMVGTVNVDETTYMFSPKVLDRATVFEIRTRTEELASDPRPLRPARPARDDVRSAYAQLLNGTVELSDADATSAFLADELRTIHGLLARRNLEFGHRLFADSLRFGRALSMAGISDRDAQLDLIVLTKLLPRVHGARRRIEPVLKDLRDVCVAGETDQSSARLPRSLAKIDRMRDAVAHDQFVSFVQ